MPVYLVQHSLSLPKEKDPERGLTEEGIADAKRIVEVAKNYNIIVSDIKHSGKKRAQQTADIFASFLSPANGYNVIDGLNPNDDVTIFAKKLICNSNIMYVGHLPFMERLVSFLITGSPELLVFKFQNSGIVCLDHDPDKHTWYIKWTLMPHIG